VCLLSARITDRFVVTFTLASLATLGASAASADVRITQATCPVAIAAPGDYRLDTDLTCQPGENGIVITASNVTVRLDGHHISGTCGAGVGILVGVVNGPMLSRVRLIGDGTVENFQTGIRAQNTAQSMLKKVTVTLQCSLSDAVSLLGPGGDWKIEGNIVRGPVDSSGISLVGIDGNVLVRNDVNNTIDLIPSSDNIIVDNIASGGGILLFRGSNRNEIHGNTANDTPAAGAGIGIVLGATANTVTGNTALNNVAFDLFDGNPGCDANKWKGNTFATANQTCIR
jgi:Right handed beta helix region